MTAANNLRMMSLLKSGTQLGCRSDGIRRETARPISCWATPSQVIGSLVVFADQGRHSPLMTTVSGATNSGPVFMYGL